MLAEACLARPAGPGQTAPCLGPPASPCRSFSSSVLGALLRPAPGAAQEPAATEISADYAAYVAGLNTARLQARLAFQRGSYQARLSVSTTGLFGAFVHSESNALVQGSWAGAGVAPSHFASTGRLHGEPRATVMDYLDGKPVIRSLVPPDDDREPVPSAMEGNTVDTLSAMVLIVRHLAQTGRCDGHVTTFDGRRVVDVTVRTAGEQTVARSGRSPYSGPAMRCDFEGRQLAGFKRDADPVELRRPRRGSAWLAQVLPGTLAIPIRLTVETGWVGSATLYLTSLQAGPPPAAGAAR